MSIVEVAKLAGVSPATVSRVINAHPSVTPTTADAVRRAIADLRFRPARRRPPNPMRSPISARATSIAFVMFGASGTQRAPAFENLLRGVSMGAQKNGIELSFAYASDVSRVPSVVTDRKIEGLILHGAKPDPSVVARLQTLPTVWVMANRHRPLWGDQVMPDNTGVGDIAARYLTGRGHRNVAYLGVGTSWSMTIRSLSFQLVARDLGAQVQMFRAAEMQTSDYWSSDVHESAGVLARQVLEASPRPTGLFIGEDRLTPVIHHALIEAGVRIGPGHTELISCNNEPAHMMGLQPSPAEIDIRVEAIGLRAIEQLLWRMSLPTRPERVRVMVEPYLITPEDVNLVR